MTATQLTPSTTARAATSATLRARLRPDRRLTPTCLACGSPHWVSVSLDEGFTRIPMCVRCGNYHRDPITGRRVELGPGWQQRAAWADPSKLNPFYYPAEVRDALHPDTPVVDAAEAVLGAALAAAHGVSKPATHETFMAEHDHRYWLVYIASLHATLRAIDVSEPWTLTCSPAGVFEVGCDICSWIEPRRRPTLRAAKAAARAHARAEHGWSWSRIGGRR